MLLEVFALQAGAAEPHSLHPPRGSKYPMFEVSGSNNKYPWWFCGPGSLNIGYLDPLGMICLRADTGMKQLNSLHDVHHLCKRSRSESARAKASKALHIMGPSSPISIEDGVVPGGCLKLRDRPRWRTQDVRFR